MPDPALGVVLVARETPTDAEPGSGEWVAYEFATRELAKEWLNENGHRGWDTDVRIIDVKQP